MTLYQDEIGTYRKGLFLATPAYTSAHLWLLHCQHTAQKDRVDFPIKAYWSLLTDKPWQVCIYVAFRNFRIDVLVFVQLSMKANFIIKDYLKLSTMVSIK